MTLTAETANRRRARCKGDCPLYTQAGRPIYERMVYQRIASHMAFMEKKFLHLERERAWQR